MTEQQQRLELLIADRLEHIADRVVQLMLMGEFDEAHVLQKEGLMLAEAYDNEENFYAIDSTALQ